jgi:hypothetical protein
MGGVTWRDHPIPPAIVGISVIDTIPRVIAKAVRLQRD